MKEQSDRTNRPGPGWGTVEKPPFAAEMFSVDASLPRATSKQHRALLNIVKNGMLLENARAMLCALVGMAAIAAGIWLCISGVAGSVRWTTKIFGASSQLTDATPGVVLFVVGFLIIGITKPSVRVRIRPAEKRRG